MPGFIWSGIRIDRTKQIHKKGRCEKPVPKINMKPFTKKIVLENGREFYGYGFGADREVINEIVFNTSMVGYQEIMSDPSYTDQMVVMTYPLIGNYGMADEDYETKTPTIGGMIVREYNDSPSNFRYTKTLNEVFEEHDIPAIWGVDTRTLTRIIRNEGTQKVIITGADTPLEEALRKVREYALPHDMVSRVSCKKRWMSRVPNHKYDVVAVDCGIKYNIIRQLNRVGCNVTVVPFDSTLEEIMAFRPDGVVLSNGPGNPQDVTPVIELVRQLRGKLPIFGICLGHQLLALSQGCRTEKLKYGHRGANQPVIDLNSHRTYVTSQNHGYAVVGESLDPEIGTVSHINANDKTCEGIRYHKINAFTVQFHPEACGGPKDTAYLFDEFIELMEGKKSCR